MGHGHASGDPASRPQTADQVVGLLKTPSPWRRELEPIYQSLSAVGEIEWPRPESEQEDWIFAISAVVFVEPIQADRARTALRSALGGRRCEYLLALLTFIRTAHYWTVVHPGLEIEDDVRELMSTHKELATLLLQDPDTAYQAQ